MSGFVRFSLRAWCRRVALAAYPVRILTCSCQPVISPLAAVAGTLSRQSRRICVCCLYCFNVSRQHWQLTIRDFKHSTHYLQFAAPGKFSSNDYFHAAPQKSKSGISESSLLVLLVLLATLSVAPVAPVTSVAPVAPVAVVLLYVNRPLSAVTIPFLRSL